MKTALEILARYNPCEEGSTWLDALSPERAWNDCPRGDWMIWAANKVGVDRKLIVLAACACARLVLHLVPEGENRPRKAIETAEAWTRGEVSTEQIRKATAAAYVGAAAYAAYAATNAAYAASASASASAAYAASASASAAYAASASASAAYAANATYAYAAYAYTSRDNMQNDCANAIRRVIPWEVVSNYIKP